MQSTRSPIDRTEDQLVFGPIECRSTSYSKTFFEYDVPRPKFNLDPSELGSKLNLVRGRKSKILFLISVTDPGLGRSTDPGIRQESGSGIRQESGSGIRQESGSGIRVRNPGQESGSGIRVRNPGRKSTREVPGSSRELPGAPGSFPGPPGGSPPRPGGALLRNR